jgi:RNA polymerase sporulation-specific sigma factor
MPTNRKNEPKKRIAKSKQNDKILAKPKVKSAIAFEKGVDKTIKRIIEVVDIDDTDIVYSCLLDTIDDDPMDELSTSSEDAEPEHALKRVGRDIKTIFDMDDVSNPLIGTPTEVRKELDNLAIKLQKNPLNQALFLKIVCYMHKYILGLVFKKYSFVKGYDSKDIYQEALIAIFKKAVPCFKKGKGMSFLNFAKMCINRHLITILDSSLNRKKDMALNTSISLDHAPSGKDEDGDESCLLSNIIPDTINGKPPFTEMERTESFERTLASINSVLSDFEREVLLEYLKDKSYREAAKTMAKTHGSKCNERSIDNALLRIRKKAMAIKEGLGEDGLPLIFGNLES